VTTTGPGVRAVPSPPAPATPEGGTKSRLIGIDATRGLALLGMIAVHALYPYDENSQPNWVNVGPSGHASAIFAVLAGVGLSLTTGRSQVPWARAGQTTAALLGRAVAVGLIGLCLGYADEEITGVILTYYAALFVMAIPLVLLGTRYVVLVGLFAALVVPALIQLAWPMLPETAFGNPTIHDLFTNPIGLLSTLLCTGSYPAAPWLSYLCCGLLLGRLRLSSIKVAWRLLIGGVALAAAAYAASWWLLGPLGGRAVLEAVGAGDVNPENDTVDDLLTFGFEGNAPTNSWWWLASDAPHSSTPPDLLGTIGVAVAVLGAMLLLGHVAYPPVRRMIRLVMVPLAAAGAMTLTLYTLHVVYMNSPLDVFEPMSGYLLQVIVVLLLGLGWRLAVGRGPLETLVTATAQRARSLEQYVEAQGVTVERPGRHRAGPPPPGGAAADTRPIAPGALAPGRRPRLVGIDATRGLALLGMMAVHILVPYNHDLQPNWVSYVATGHASAAFAVLAGVGLSLSTGRARVPLTEARASVMGLLGRALTIGLIGLTLGYANPDITGVILVYYAVMFVLATPLILVPTRYIVGFGLICALIVPVLSQLVRPELPGAGLGNPSFAPLVTDPGGLLSELLFTGPYPVLPWMAYICAGLVVGRLNLGSAKVAWRLLAGGVAIAATAAGISHLLMGPVGGSAAVHAAGTGDGRIVDDLLIFGFDGTTPTTSWWWLATGAPHASTPPDLIGTIGVSVAVLGAMLLLGTIGRSWSGRLVHTLLIPLAAAGSMTLTLYAAHVVVLNSPLDTFVPTTDFLLQMAVALTFATLWRRLVGRGPLESLVSAVAGFCRALVVGRRSRPGVRRADTE
jgi:uncharacterized membrane protein